MLWLVFVSLNYVYRSFYQNLIAQLKLIDFHWRCFVIFYPSHNPEVDLIVLFAFSEASRVAKLLFREQNFSMISKFQYLAIFLYQKAFWYLPTCLIDWNLETCSLRVNKAQKWNSFISLAASVGLGWVFVIASIVATGQGFLSDRLLQNESIISYATMWLLNLFALLGCGCFAIFCMETDCIEGLNQLILVHNQLRKHHTHGTYN